jgi:hypothetical protein
VLLGDGSQRYRDIAAILVAAGANVTIPDKDGVNALEHARRKGYAELVVILSTSNT